MKKIIWLVLFLTIFPFAISAHGGTDDENLVIQMTRNGFQPSTLTVTEGDTVTFVNNDTVNRWPASNLHPTHGIYPEFDPQKGIVPGDYWQFTFDKVGTWKMHDHLLPSFTGEITVLANPQIEVSFWQKIKDWLEGLFS